MRERKIKKALGVCFAFVLLFIPFLIPCICRAAPEKADPAVHLIDIGIAPSAYQELTTNEDEPRFTAQISIDDNSFRRGNIKLRGNASKGLGLFMQTKRIPIQLSFERPVPMQDSLNNSCVKLINSITPYRLLAEYIALDMFSYCGIPTPAHTFAFLRYNDVDFGLYLAVEDVNAEFLAKQIPEGKGSLFKGSQKDLTHEYSISNWFGSLEMIVDNGSDRIMKLLDTLAQGEGYEAYIDVDEFLRFFACLAAGGASSSFLTEQNNFFLYDTGEKFLLLPWDNSDAFGAYTDTNGIDHYRMDPWEDIDYPPPIFTLLMEKEANRETYHAYIRELNESFLSPERFDPYFNSLAALVRPYLERDPTMLINQPYSVPVQAVSGVGTLNALLDTIHHINRNLSDQLSGKTDGFYFNPVYLGNEDFPEGVIMQDDMETILPYYERQSPRYDPDITDKICSNYSVWLKEHWYVLLKADSAAEVEIAAATLIAAVILSAALTHKTYKRKQEVKNE